MPDRLKKNQLFVAGIKQINACWYNFSITVFNSSRASTYFFERNSMTSTSATAINLTQGAYRISDLRSELDLVAIHAYLTQSYWSPGIPIGTVQRAIENSLCFGLYHEGRQIGFARVVSDFATFGYLCDVYVLGGHRGQGLSKWLMQCIMQHPNLQGLRRFMLATRDAHGLYQLFGFAAPANPASLMEITKPNIYLQAQ